MIPDGHEQPDNCVPKTEQRPSCGVRAISERHSSLLLSPTQFSFAQYRLETQQRSPWHCGAHSMVAATYQPTAWREHRRSTRQWRQRQKSACRFVMVTGRGSHSWRTRRTPLTLLVWFECSLCYYCTSGTVLVARSFHITPSCSRSRPACADPTCVCRFPQWLASCGR